MKIAVSANGAGLDAPASPVFGRCPTFVFVDTETMEFQALNNPAVVASGGAGIQAAQFVVEQGAQAVLTGNVGPNAADVFRAANLPVYLNEQDTVRAAVEAFKAGQLPPAQGANVEAHAGMRLGRGRGMGRGRMRAAASPPTPTPSRQKEIAALRQQATELRQQLADVIDRIEKLEKES